MVQKKTTTTPDPELYLPEQSDTTGAAAPGQRRIPTPSASATSAGDIGPGAVAAEEKPANAGNAIALRDDERAMLGTLAKRVGSVDELIRWLRLHPDLK